MNRKSNSICGKKTSTEATPRHTPSISSDSTQLCPSSVPILSPPAFSRLPNPSLSGCPIENTTWNTANTTTRKTSGPQMRSSRTPSMRFVHSLEMGALYFVRVLIPVAHCRYDRGFPITGSSIFDASGTSGVAPGEPASGGRTSALRFRKCVIASSPAPRVALIFATGTPSSWASASVSTRPPRASIRSLMFSSTSVGRPRLSTGAANISCRRSCSESSTSRIASGAGVPGISPCSTSIATRASSE